MSLPYVVCDLGRAFAPGQVYVALSRATAVEGLQITRLDPRRIEVSKSVRKYVRLHCLDDFEQPNNAAMLDPTPYFLT